MTVPNSIDTVDGFPVLACSCLRFTVCKPQFQPPDIQLVLFNPQKCGSCPRIHGALLVATATGCSGRIQEAKIIGAAATSGHGREVNLFTRLSRSARSARGKNEVSQFDCDFLSTAATHHTAFVSQSTAATRVSIHRARSQCSLDCLPECCSLAVFTRLSPGVIHRG
jgi:hypothetical protein